jgi:hypothetical protein
VGKILKCERLKARIGIGTLLIIIAISVAIPINALESNQTIPGPKSIDANQTEVNKSLLATSNQDSDVDVPRNQTGGTTYSSQIGGSDSNNNTGATSEVIIPSRNNQVNPEYSPDGKLVFAVNYSIPSQGIVGLSVDSDVNSFTNLCTLWTIISEDGENRLCYGDATCCDYLGLESKWSEWNTILYLTRGSNGVGEKNLVTVQLLASTGEIIPGKFTNIHLSNVQKIEVLLPNTKDMEGTSAQILKGEPQLTGMYMQLGDPENPQQSTANISVELDERIQGEAKIGFPVNWYQKAVAINHGSSEIDYNLSLWDHIDKIGTDFLNDVSGYRISVNGKTISESSVARLRLLPGEEKTIGIVYETPPVILEKTCDTVSIKDILPKDAVITGSDIPLDTPVKTVCRVRVYHNTVTHYKDIKVNLQDIDPKTLDSIYYVEGARYLTLTNGSIDVPSLEES